MDTSFLSTQVNNAIGQLHGLFDEIGVPGHERESRETEASYLLGNQKRKLTLLSFSRLYQRLSITNFVWSQRMSICHSSFSHCYLLEFREKTRMTEEAYRIIKTIRQMEASLEDEKPHEDYALEDEHLKVFTPLARCLKGLKEKHNSIAKIHRERFEQVKSKCREEV